MRDFVNFVLTVKMCFFRLGEAKTFWSLGDIEWVVLVFVRFGAEDGNS